MGKPQSAFEERQKGRARLSKVIYTPIVYTYYCCPDGLWSCPDQRPCVAAVVIC